MSERVKVALKEAPKKTFRLDQLVPFVPGERSVKIVDTTDWLTSPLSVKSTRKEIFSAARVNSGPPETAGDERCKPDTGAECNGGGDDPDQD